MGDGGSPAATNVGVRRGGGGGTGLAPAASQKINLSAYSGKLPADNFPGQVDQAAIRQQRVGADSTEFRPTALAPAPGAGPSDTPLAPATPTGPPMTAAPVGPPATTPATTPAAGGGGAPRPVQKLWTQTDAQGNPSGIGTIGGQQYVRDGSWWVKKSVVDANPGILGMQKGQNPALDKLVESNRMEYSQGVTTMATEMGAAQRAAKTTATGYDSEAERNLRQQWANEIGVNEKSDENQGDPTFVAKQVLVDLIKGGHVDKMSNGLFFSYHGDTAARPWEFKNANGQDVAPTPELVAMASKAQQAKNARYQTGGGSGSGTGGAPPPLLAKGGLVKQTPGGKKLNINGKSAIVGEGAEDEAVMPLSVLSSIVENAAARGAGKNVSASAPLLSSHAGAGQPVPKLAGGGLVPRDRAGIAPGGPDPGSGMPGSSGSGGGGGGIFASGQLKTVEEIARGGDPTTYSPYAGYSPYQKQGMSAEEQAQLQAVTKIAQQLSGRGEGTYNIGSGAYNDAVKYFQTLTKGNRGQMMAAVAPSAELIREQSEGAKGAILAGQGRSGLRDMALANVDQQSQGDIARLTAGVQPGAAAQLGALGGQGIQMGNAATEASGQLSSAEQQALTQSRQYEEGLGESSRQFGAGLEENSRQFGANLTENSRQFNANLAELVRSNTIKEEQAQAALNLQRTMMDQDYQFKMQQFQESIRQFNVGQKNQASSDKGKTIAGVAGTVLTAAAIFF